MRCGRAGGDGEREVRPVGERCRSGARRAAAARGIEGVLEYASDLFDRGSVAALGERLVRLLAAAVADPERAIGGRLTILAAAERAHLLEGWNDTARPVCGASLPELFAAQAARTPEAVAVVFGERRLSYAALDAHANRLAHHLRGLGVGPETVVGLCVERSPEMVIGLLGILKAGGAYLPLDPHYPAERLAFMLADAGAPVLVGEAAAAGAAAVRPAPQLVRLDADWPAIARQPEQRAGARRSTPHNPAYVIYTSGSTGTPKGVVVAHGGLGNFMLAMRERFRLGAWRPPAGADHAFGFDVSVLELFRPLLGGGAAGDRCCASRCRTRRRCWRMLAASEADVLHATLTLCARAMLRRRSSCVRSSASGDLLASLRRCRAARRCHVRRCATRSAAATARQVRDLVERVRPDRERRCDWRH